jgi:hypothetical protein
MFKKLQKSEVPKELLDYFMLSCFGGTQGEDYYRYDFMYAFHDEESMPSSFVLAQEYAKDYIWLPFGGTIPSARGFTSVKNFHEMIEDLSHTYKHIGAQVRNDNYPMLKMYLAMKFEVIGTRRNPEGQIFLEFYKKVGE